MIFIAYFRFYLVIFSFGWGSREDFTIFLLFRKFCSPFFLFFKPLRILLLFFWIEVSVHTDKFPDTLFNLIPFKNEFRCVVSKPF